MGKVEATQGDLALVAALKLENETRGSRLFLD